MTVGSPPGIDVEDIDLEQSVVPVAHELDTVSPPPPLALVVFGASGDLAARKLLPAIAGLAEHGALADGFTVVGVARTNWTDEEFRQGRPRGRSDKPGPTWKELVKRFRYVAGEYGHPDTFDQLKTVLDEADAKLGTAGNRVYYLATIPELFGTGGHRPRPSTAAPCPGPAARSPACVVEKPFGRDLASALALERHAARRLRRGQIFRIDHYMGKETVQNVLALRFANAIFEPIWNRRYVDHIQITVAEQLGVEHRGGFYETAGALRDIVQNHVMQVLALTLMEPPASHRRPGHPRREGQAPPGRRHPRRRRGGRSTRSGPSTRRATIDGEPVVGYREEPDVDPRQPDRDLRGHAARRSTTGGGPASPSTSAPASGSRSGPPRWRCSSNGSPTSPSAASSPATCSPNALVLRIQPDEGICLRFGAKVPGEAFRLRSVAMDFSYAETFPGPAADGYERLLHDAMVGDATLFIRTDEVEQAWRIVDPFLEAWSRGRRAPGPLPGRDLGPARGRARSLAQRPAPVARPVSGPPEHRPTSSTTSPPAFADDGHRPSFARPRSSPAVHPRLVRGAHRPALLRAPGRRRRGGRIDWSAGRRLHGRRALRARPTTPTPTNGWSARRCSTASARWSARSTPCRATRRPTAYDRLVAVGSPLFDLVHLGPRARRAHRLALPRLRRPSTPPRGGWSCAQPRPQRTAIPTTG